MKRYKANLSKEIFKNISQVRISFTFKMSNSDKDNKGSAGLKKIPSDGDCFYRAVVEAFLMNG